MNAICSSKKLNAVLAVLLALFVTVSAMLLPTFAEEAPSEEDTATVSEPATDALSGEATEAATSGATEAVSSDTTPVTTPATDHDHSHGDDLTRGIINLAVGAVILIGLIVLAIVFRKKIPGWIKALRSECGKIAWCSKDKLRKNTAVVVIIILALTVLVGLLDYAFSTLIVDILGKLF